MSISEINFVEEDLMRFVNMEGSFTGTDMELETWKKKKNFVASRIFMR